MDLVGPEIINTYTAGHAPVSQVQAELCNVRPRSGRRRIKCPKYFRVLELVKWRPEIEFLVILHEVFPIISRLICQSVMTWRWGSYVTNRGLVPTEVLHLFSQFRIIFCYAILAALVSGDWANPLVGVISLSAVESQNDLSSRFSSYSYLLLWI